jgi:hypothetical protein
MQVIPEIPAFFNASITVTTDPDIRMAQIIFIGNASYQTGSGPCAGPCSSAGKTIKGTGISLLDGRACMHSFMQRECVGWCAPRAFRKGGFFRLNVPCLYLPPHPCPEDFACPGPAVVFFIGDLSCREMA